MHKTDPKANNKSFEKSQKQRSKVVDCGVGLAEETKSMPSQKRLLPENLDDSCTESSLQQHIPRRQRHGRPRSIPTVLQPHGDDDDEDSEGIDPADLPEFIWVDLEAIHSDFTCAICLDIIKDTRAVMGCMHRFCAVCIEKLLRNGKKRECPTCRLPCASRRSLRDDSNYDKLIAILFPDTEKYEEEEEISILEKAKTLNKQIQASISRISKCQSDALSARVIPSGGSENGVRETERFSWGSVGVRSKTRHHSGSSNRNAG